MADSTYFTSKKALVIQTIANVIKNLAIQELLNNRTTHWMLTVTNGRPAFDDMSTILDVSKIRYVSFVEA